MLFLFDILIIVLQKGRQKRTMTALSEKILSSYQVRKTKKQKTAFIEMMQKEFPELRVEEGGSMKSRNLVLGDVEKARVVLGAHYDTCAALPFPNFITPKNFLFTMLYGVLVAIPFILIMLAAEIALLYLTNHVTISTWGALIVFLIVYQGVLMGGPANKHTVNDNTSGVITLCELIAVCKEKNITDVAFVFFDHEEVGLVGSACFRKRHRKQMKEKLLVNFDCVSDGDHLLFVMNKPAKKQYEQTLRNALSENPKKTVHLEKSSTTFYPSDQMGFPVSIAVSALKKTRFLGLYLDRIHTKRDTVMDEDNITYLCESMERFLTEITC